MRSMRMLFAVVAVLALAGGLVLGQQGSSSTQALTGQDYEEIKALYARYNQGSDFQDAELFVSAFADDAVMIRPGGAKIEGMAALRAERAERYQGRTGDNGRRHMNASHVITATPTGAKGRAYYVLLDVTTRPPTMTASGYYEDEFVRTRQGWKIKRRVLHSDPATP
jgi:uncharacterized protein (TIGR02246 family)